MNASVQAKELLCSGRLYSHEISEVQTLRKLREPPAKFEQENLHLNTARDQTQAIQLLYKTLINISQNYDIFNNVT